MSIVIIDWKVLKKRVPWSRQHVQRLEHDGKFPVRVRLSAARVGWVESEIEDFLAKLIRERGEQAP